MPGSDVLLIDLGVELTDRLRLLDYPTYRARIHPMLTDLVAYHRPSLRDDVASLAEHTLTLLTPGSVPDLVSAELAERRWTEIRDEHTRGMVGIDNAKMYNARTLLWMLGYVHTELSDARYRPMAAYVGAALVDWQIRPLAPHEILMPDRLDTAVADPGASRSRP